MKDQVLTKPEKKALTILSENPEGLHPKRFAELMWPDSPCWTKSYNCGPNGASYGIRMYTAAGGYLGRLSKKGTVRRRYDWSYTITTAGFALLRVALEGK